MVGVWISAFRLRTLPLSISCVGMGAFLASMTGEFDVLICVLCIVTTVLLQILSNLANDYGDSQNGADNSSRKGPERTIQSGKISKSAMLKAIICFSILSFASGIVLIAISFGWFSINFNVFLAIGVLAIIAAIKYTMGNKPYGYAGLGDISVLIFFGLVGVAGTYYLFTETFHVAILFPALSCGLLATGVLNVNNIRDIESDKKAGKLSIPVRLGRYKAVVYHWILIISAMALITLFTLTFYFSTMQFLYVLSVPLFVYNGIQVGKRKESIAIDPLLKQLAISTLVFVLLFGVGNLLSLLYFFG